MGPPPSQLMFSDTKPLSPIHALHFLVYRFARGIAGMTLSLLGEFIL